MKNMLEVVDLKIHFYTEDSYVTAVDEISFNVNEKEILGIVGESGCGKSATAQSILKLHDDSIVEYEGEVNFENQNLLTLKPSKMQKIRGHKISMIFQDPMSSLDPVYTIGDQIVEAILIHQNKSKKEAYKEAIEMLRITGLPDPEQRIKEYPHQLSGGMRQRVLIAIALSCDPRVLIADEPTTALDVTVQAQILDLIKNLGAKTGMGTIFITHDLGVVSELCDRVVVMYLGQVVEEAKTKSLFDSPLHPYTKGLMKSIPKLEGERSEKLHTIKGKVPSLQNIPKGCRFAERCTFATEICREKVPELRTHNQNHKVRCWHYEEILKKEGGDKYFD